jgi:hypothetical protein
MKRPRPLPAVDRQSTRYASEPIGTNVRACDLAETLRGLFPPTQIMGGMPGGYGRSLI